MLFWLTFKAMEKYLTHLSGYCLTVANCLKLLTFDVFLELLSQKYSHSFWKGASGSVSPSTCTLPRSYRINFWKAISKNIQIFQQLLNWVYTVRVKYPDRCVKYFSIALNIVKYAFQGENWWQKLVHTHVAYLIYYMYACLLYLKSTHRAPQYVSVNSFNSYLKLINLQNTNLFPKAGIIIQVQALASYYLSCSNGCALQNVIFPNVTVSYEYLSSLMHFTSHEMWKCNLITFFMAVFFWIM